MITKEQNYNKSCLFCVSDYHLEMILLPYIMKKSCEYKTIVFTENNLEKSIDILLEKINLKENDKRFLKNINWKNNDDYKFEIIMENIDKNLNVIVNGSIQYIKMINKRLESINKDLEIVDCFHVGGPDIDISEISKKYKCILNTRKI